MSQKEKKGNVKVLDDYDDELPPEINLIDIEKETEKEQEDALAKKRREDHFINNPKYRNSPIPEDLTSEYKRRTPTPTFDMIKEGLEQKEENLKMEIIESSKKRMKKGGHHPFIVPLILLSGKYSMRRNKKNRETRKRKVRNMLKKIKKKNRSRFTKIKGKNTRKVRKGRKKNTRRSRK